MAMNVKFLKGTIEGYGKVANVDENALYFCTDGKLYLGNNLIAEVNQTDATGVNNLITSAIEKLDADKTSTGGSFVNVQVVETDGQITEVKVNDAALATEFAKYQLKGDYKTKQASVADPTEKGKSLTFIDTIAQNTNGEIVATKKSVNLDNYSTTEQANGLYAAKAYEGKVDTLIGDDNGKSVRTIANEELAAQLIAEGAAESLNSLQEIAAWIQSHPDDAAAMNSAIEAIKTEIGGTYVAGIGFTDSRIDELEKDMQALGTLAAEDVVSTEHIDDKAVTKAKLSADVQTSLDKADSAVQSVSLTSGTNNGTLKLTVNGTATDNIKVTGLQDAAYTTVNALNRTAQGYADAVRGATTNTVKDCVDAINALNAGTAQANKDINAISTSVNDVVNQLTWGKF